MKAQSEIVNGLQVRVRYPLLSIVVLKLALESR